MYTHMYKSPPLISLAGVEGLRPEALLATYKTNIIATIIIIIIKLIITIKY